MSTVPLLLGVVADFFEIAFFTGDSLLPGLLGAGRVVFVALILVIASGSCCQRTGRTMRWVRGASPEYEQ